MTICPKNAEAIEEMRAAVVKEGCEAYRDVEDASRVIKSETALVVIDKNMVGRLENGEKVMSNELSRASVRMWFPKAKKLLLPTVTVAGDELFWWNRSYDNFIGYMCGLMFEIDGYEII